MPIRRILHSNLFLLLASILVTLLVLEAVLNWIGPTSLQVRRNENSFRSFVWNPENTRFDSELGYMTRPNLDVPFENWEYKTRVRTNSWGFRDDEESLHDPKILLLGDSYCFGWGVEDDKTVDKFVERETGEKVLNMGAPGFGTIQQFLLLQRYCGTENATGCTVVFLYYINDRIENFIPPGGGVPTLRKEDRRLLFTPASEEAYNAAMRVHETSFVTELSRMSAVADLVFGTLFNPRRGIVFASDFEWEDWKVKEKQFPGVPVGPFEVLENLLRVLKLYALERDLQIRMVMLPFYTHFTDNDSSLDYSTEKKVFRMLDIPYRDLLDDFTREDFYPHDRHLTPKGQEKLGVAIAKFLEDEKNP
ncbi:MAG: hypothetical protein KC940_25225 [Candidatus Omnitrophica bacterium]|nr:hypothetical protein [Candidatus Omnitrophota bacterium]